MALETGARKRTLRQKNISLMGPYTWNNVNNNLKLLSTTTSFTHNYNKIITALIKTYIIIIISSQKK